MMSPSWDSHERCLGPASGPHAYPQLEPEWLRPSLAGFIRAR